MSAITRLNCLLASPFLPVFMRFRDSLGASSPESCQGSADMFGVGFIDFSDLNRCCAAHRASPVLFWEF